MTQAADFRTIPGTPREMVSTALFDQFKRGDGVSPSEHVRVFWASPSVRSAEDAVEYLWTTRLIKVEKHAVYAAVKRGELSAFRIGKGLTFRPADLDEWFFSRQVNP